MKLWVVGANSGMGAFIAKFGAGMYDVVKTGTEVDVRNWDDVDDFVNRYGPFHRVIYSAGVSQLAWIDQLGHDDIRDLYDINVFGFLGVMKALTKRQDSGRVCAIISDSANNPMRGSIAYCSSKAALEMAVRTAARELAPDWQVNGISPSAVADTEMTRKTDAEIPSFRGWTAEKARQYELGSIPMGRRCTVDEVATVIFDILDGPSFLTGSIIKLTGGK